MLEGSGAGYKNPEWNDNFFQKKTYRRLAMALVQDTFLPLFQVGERICLFPLHVSP